jgi:hypothetical protein
MRGGRVNGEKREGGGGNARLEGDNYAVSLAFACRLLAHLHLTSDFVLLLH